MTGFWFFCYVAMNTYGIIDGTLKAGAEDPKIHKDVGSRSISSISMGLGASLVLLLAYHAGVYNYVTGYEGTPFWFSVWFVLVIMAFIFNIIKRGIPAVITIGISVFLLIQINAFVQLGNIIQ